MMLTGENSEYERAMDNMDNLIDTFKLSIVMIHHDTVPRLDEKGKEVNWFHPRGPRTLEGWFDTLIQVTGDRDSDDRTLLFECRHARKLIQPLDITINRTKLWAERKP